MAPNECAFPSARERYQDTIQATRHPPTEPAAYMAVMTDTGKAIAGMMGLLVASGAVATLSLSNAGLYGILASSLSSAQSHAGKALRVGSPEKQALAPWPRKVTVHALAGTADSGVRANPMVQAWQLITRVSAGGRPDRRHQIRLRRGDPQPTRLLPLHAQRSGFARRQAGVPVAAKDGKRGPGVRHRWAGLRMLSRLTSRALSNSPTSRLRSSRIASMG